MNDETLILYYYKDGLSRREREVIAQQLATDPDVAERYRVLCEELERADLPAAAPPPSDMVHRWHEAIDRAADREYAHGRNTGFHFGSFFRGAVVAGALAVGVGIGIYVSGVDDRPRPPPQTAQIAPRMDSGAFVRGLRVHLRETGEELSGLQASPAADRRSLILEIIGQNRLFERSAEVHEADDIARLLRAFELVLLQLATDDMSPEESAALQSKLLFEMNVVLTKLGGVTSNEPETI